MAGSKRPVTDCKADPERLAVFKECMATYGVEKNAPGSEWPWNCISTRAVAYSCGAVARSGETVKHEHDPGELDRCRRLSAEAARLMEGQDVGMGSESGDPFRPFFVAANVGAAVPAEVTDELIRRAFGGTIYPDAEVVVEPLREEGQWWEQVVADAEDDAELLRPWRALIAWFQGRKDLHGPAFVMIGEDPLGGDNGGCVFPRLAVAITAAGSLVGIGGYVVHT